jgi:uncharacterized peroxidase-related enzyme
MGSDERASGLAADPDGAPLPPADRALVDYALKLTRTPAAMSRDDVEALRGHGFDDRAILQATLIAAFFNYVNRVADALGVGRE